LTDDAGFWGAFGSRELWQIIGLSLSVSASASIAATLIGLPAGVALGSGAFEAGAR
jgi:ABC-type spermidine/putrescine transport system permease subunit II